MTWSDWWRGYSEADLESVKRKVYSEGPHEPGAVIPLDLGEMRALRALTRSLALSPSAPATSSPHDSGSKTKEGLA